MISRILDRLEARLGRRWGIRNLMMYIVIGTAIVYVADYMFPVFFGPAPLSFYLSFNRELILRGQIWRVLTFLFVPVNDNILFLLIGLYFDWMMGEYLQSEWGTLRFNLFYATGFIGAMIVGFLTGYTTAYYLNTSLMLAVAILYPNMPLSLYGIIQIKLKWLAIFSLGMMVLPVIMSMNWAALPVLAVSLLNVLLFFIDGMIKRGRDAYRRYKWKQNWRNSWKR